MFVERSMHPSWLSNSWLLFAADGGDALVVDTGGPAEPLLAIADAHGLTVTTVLLTHHHHDHVAETEIWRERHGARSFAHALEAGRIDGGVDATLVGGDRLTVGGLGVEVLHVPGHTDGQLNFVVTAPGEPARVCTGDTLFAGSVGGTRAPGHTSYAELRRSIMETLMALDPVTEVLPGHERPTTVGAELETNPFVAVWSGRAPEGEGRCVAGGRPARLIVWADDYDGGHKAWVRYDDDGADDLVPGSRVELDPAP